MCQTERLTERDKYWAKYYYKRGWTYREIGHFIDVNHSIVWRFLNKNKTTWGRILRFFSNIIHNHGKEKDNKV